MGRALMRAISETQGAVVTGALEAPGSDLIGKDAGILAGLPANGIEVSKTVLMAGSVVLTVPVVLLFLAAERLLTEGLTSGADKS